jgi:hypothetical protein
MTEEREIEAAAQIRQLLDTYLNSAEFEQRANAACAEIEKGGLRTTAELAEALGLPERFLEIALAKQAAKFAPNNGADLQ